MRRIICLLSVAVIALFAVGCSSNNESAETTRKKVTAEDAAPTTTVEASAEQTEPEIDYTFPDCRFSKVFEVPSDLRENAVENMRKMANVEWVCGNDVTYTKEKTNWTFTKTLEKGKTYLGIPYADTKVALGEFSTYLVNGTYTPVGEDWGEIQGVQCVSSVLSAIQEFTDIDGASEVLNPATEYFKLDKVGDYKTEKDEASDAICSNNGMSTMVTCYSALQKGDIILHTAPAIHVRMIVDNKVVKDSSGEINADKSYVTTIEQTDSFDYSVTARSNSTWYVDHTYTYKELFETTYLPVTLKEYTTGAEKGYITMDKEITADMLAKGELTGTIKSNRNIKYVYYSIKDASGNIAGESRATNMVKKKAINNRDYAYKLFEKLTAGTYTFSVEAGFGVESVKIEEVEFTYSKK